MRLRILFLLLLSLVHPLGAQGQDRSPFEPPRPTGQEIDSLEKSDIVHWNFNPLFSYLRGYRLGFLTSSRIEGVIIKTLEGSLQLGFRSSAAKVLDQECMRGYESAITNATTETERVRLQQRMERRCLLVMNPWEFSSLNLGLQSKLANAPDPVLLYFIEYRIYPLTKTWDIIYRVWPVRPERNLPTSSFTTYGYFPVSRWFHYAFGVYEGRIISAAVEGSIRQNYLVTIQIGPAGNNFIRMNVAHTPMYNFIVQCMSTGRYLRIYFLRMFSVQAIPASLIFGYDTPYRIYRVDMIPDPI